MEPEQPSFHAPALQPGHRVTLEPITDALAHVSEAQERTEDKGRNWRSLDGDTATGWGDLSQPFLGTGFPFGPKKSQESWR